MVKKYDSKWYKSQIKEINHELIVGNYEVARSLVSYAREKLDSPKNRKNINYKKIGGELANLRRIAYGEKARREIREKTSPYNLEKSAIREHLNRAKKILNKDRRKGLEHRLNFVLPIVAIIGILSSVFFLSLSATGNVVANEKSNPVVWVGGVLLVLGISAGFFWLKEKF